MSRSTMTGPSMNVGNQIGTRSSTRVHGPPGGASSISLGWGAPSSAPAPVREPARRTADVYAPESSRYGAMPVPAAAPVAVAPSRAAPVAVAPSRVTDYAPAVPMGRADARDNAYKAIPAPEAAAPRGAGVTSSNAYASGANQNCGNVITDRRTTRVLSAPGGRSSIVLG